jgi:hypothetical protein
MIPGPEALFKPSNVVVGIKDIRHSPRPEEAFHLSRVLRPQALLHMVDSGCVMHPSRWALLNATTSWLHGHVM